MCLKRSREILCKEPLKKKLVYGGCHLFVLAGVEINFEVPGYTVREQDGQIEVCVRVASGTLQRNLVLTLSTEDAAAIGQFLKT